LRGHYDLVIHDPTPERGTERTSDPQMVLPIDGGKEPAGEGPELSARKAPIENYGREAEFYQGSPDADPLDLDSHSARTGPELSARKAPGAPMNIKEGNNLLESSMLQREPSLDVGSLGSNGAGDESAGRSAAPVSAVLTEFFEARTAFLATNDPNQQRADLKRRLNKAVGNPSGEDWWVAGCTAALVVNGQIEIDRMLRWADTVQRRRNLPEGDPNRIDKPQEWLQATVSKLCNERRLPFGKRTAP